MNSKHLSITSATLILLATGFTGCRSPQPSPRSVADSQNSQETGLDQITAVIDKMKSLQVGMTKAEVGQLLGHPLSDVLSQTIPGLPPSDEDNVEPVFSFSEPKPGLNIMFTFKFMKGKLQSWNVERTSQ